MGAGVARRGSDGCRRGSIQNSALPFPAPPAPCAAYMSTEHQGIERESSLQIDLLAWYEVNKRNVFMGLGLIVVVIGVTMVWKHTRETAVREASSALLVVARPGGDEAARPDPAKLLQVAQQHSGAPAAVQAVLLAGRELFIAGKYSEARAQFEKATGERSILGAVATYGVAACVDAEKGGAEALTAYQAVATHPAAGPLAGQARLAKARIHEALNQNSEALAIYDELGRDKDRDVASDAFMRRATLLRAHPELDKSASLTNAVKVLPAAGR